MLSGRAGCVAAGAASRVPAAGRAVSARHNTTVLAVRPDASRAAPSGTAGSQRPRRWASPYREASTAFGSRVQAAPNAQVSQGQLDKARDIISQRVDSYGVSEAEVTTQGGRNIVVSIPGQPDAKTARWLADVLARAGLAADAAVFSPAFAASPAFQELQAGRYRSVAGFNPADYCASLLVADVTLVPGRESQPVEMLTVSLSLRLRVLSPADGALRREIEVSAKGAAFKEADAARIAFERAESPLVAKVEQLKN